MSEFAETCLNGDGTWEVAASPTVRGTATFSQLGQLALKLPVRVRGVREPHLPGRSKEPVPLPETGTLFMEFHEVEVC